MPLIARRLILAYIVHPYVSWGSSCSIPPPKGPISGEGRRSCLTQRGRDGHHGDGSRSDRSTPLRGMGSISTDSHLKCVLSLPFGNVADAKATLVRFVLRRHFCVRRIGRKGGGFPFDNESANTCHIGPRMVRCELNCMKPERRKESIHERPRK